MWEKAGRRRIKKQKIIIIKSIYDSENGASCIYLSVLLFFISVKVYNILYMYVIISITIIIITMMSFLP